MLENITIVMVETSHPGNIGAAARALKTMGLSQLRLVKPKEYPSAKASWRASGAADVLDQATVFSSLEAALKDAQFVVGASARNRKLPWPMMLPKEMAEKCQIEAARPAKVAIVFGREDRGLTNEELQKCHHHVYIPGNEEYSVLNVASAVQVICYELRMSFLDKAGENEIVIEDYWDENFVPQEKMEQFYQHLKRALIHMNFYDPKNPKQLIPRFKRLFNRTRLDEMEYNMMRGIFTAIEKTNSKS